MSNFTPLGGRVALLRDGVSEKVTASGIFIPETAQDKPQTATIIAVASTGRDEAESAMLRLLGIGQRVLLGKYSGVDVEVGGRMLTIVPVGDILGVIG